MTTATTFDMPTVPPTETTDPIPQDRVGHLEAFLQSLTIGDHPAAVGYHTSVATASRFNLKNSGVLVEGDSLLLHFLCMAFEDGSRLVDCQYGASSLHLCYLVNQFLDTFATHGIPVTVVFFRDHRGLYANQHYLLLRELVIKSIEGIDKSFGMCVKQFASFLGGEFDQFLAARLSALVPLELMLINTNLMINREYGEMLLAYWGVAVANIADCDLGGVSQIWDVSREDKRNCADLTKAIDASAIRSERYEVEHCSEIDRLLALTAVDVEGHDQDNNEGKGGNDHSADVGHWPLFQDGTPRVHYDTLIALLGGLAEKYPQLAAFAKSHIDAVRILNTTHPKDRAQYYLPDIVPMLSVEQTSAFNKYCKVFATTVLNTTAESDSVKDNGSNECTLFVGDLWDGRLLVFLVGEETAIRQPPPDFGKPFEIEGILVDNVRRVAAEKFADVAHLHHAATAYSDNHAAHRGVGGAIKDASHTHSHRLVGELPLHGYNPQKFYDDCVFDFVPQLDDRQPPQQFDSERTRIRNPIENTSESEQDGRVDESLKNQKDIDADTLLDLQRSGKTQLDAVASGNSFIPLGPARNGWQDLFINDETQFAPELPPRYNALTTDSSLEAQLAEHYMYEPGFRPEPWQLKMLWSIEQRRSVLIMAPTSSGKTLAAKYAMRKVCWDNVNSKDSSKKGRGIFVQPTNALVNQTFGSFLVDPHVGIGRVAIFTAEVRSPNFSDHSYEVLITNPQCLKILLTSGHTNTEENKGSFYKSLKVVVFDEVHNVGQNDEESGVVWEQLLSTISCPIIGLSATLANAGPFYKWLCATKKQQVEQMIATHQEVLGDGSVDKLVHCERTTPLHYFIKAHEDNKRILDPQHLLLRNNNVSFQNEPFRDGQDLNIIANDDVQEWPIKSIRFGWNARSSSGLYVRLCDKKGDSMCNLTILAAHRMLSTHSEYQVSVKAKHRKEDNEWATKDCKPLNPVECCADSCWVGLKMWFDAEGKICFKVFSVKAEIDESSNLVTMFSLPLFDTVKKVNINVLRKVGFKTTIAVDSFAVDPLDKAAPAAYSVTHTHPTTPHNVNINPLQFLPSFDHHSDAKLAAFFDVVPHLKLSDIQALVIAMQQSPELMSFVDTHHLSEHAVGSYEDVDKAYKALRDLVSKQREMLTPSDVVGLHQYAQFRIDFSECIANLHAAVLQLPALLDRIFVDALCAFTLRAAGIDWYGEQWLDLDRYTLPMELLEDTLRQDLKQCPKVSVVTYTLNKVTASVFANNIVGAAEEPGLFCVYPSSVTAVNRGIYYFLHLLLKRDQGNAVVALPKNPAPTALAGTDAGDGQPDSAQPELEAAGGVSPFISADSMHTSLIRILEPAATPKSDGKNSFSSEFVAKMLAEMMESGKEEIGIQRLRTVCKEGKNIVVNDNYMKQPTLIFHISKQNFERFLEDLTGDLLNEWFGSADHKGCFLTPHEIEMIDNLPNTSKARKLGLKYGIGLHTAVVKEGRKYLSAVETLFQNKKLLFVFSTTSLSYGINMPCSRVVFLGDSPHINTSVFRQSSGRAGRRGHTSEAGNIYFVGFALPSIIRKLCTPLDDLLPRQAVSPAYILKLTSVSATCHESNRPWVDQMAIQGLLNPLFERLLEDKEIIRKQFRSALLNSINFSWSFLRQRGYINDTGAAQVKATLPYQLDYLEPHCFLLAEMFDDFLCDRSDSPKGLLGLVEQVPVTMADKAQLDWNVFMVLVYLASYSSADEEASTASNQLPPVVREAWARYNEQVIRSLVGFMRFHSAAIVEEQFPLNPSAFPPSVKMSSEGAARSCFTASSGRGDDFHSIEELLLSVKRGMIIDSRIIPTIDIHDHINDVLLTTFKHGTLSDDRDAASTCESFSRSLRGVVVGLEKMHKALSAKPEKGSKLEALMQSFLRVRDDFVSQFRRAKKMTNLVEGVIVRKGVLTRNPDNNASWMLHYYDVKANQLRYFSDVERLMGEDHWEDMDCVQFDQPRGNWKNVSNMKHLCSEDGINIQATACTGRVMHVSDSGKMGSLSVDSHYAEDNVELQFYSGWSTKTNHFVRVVHSAEVCPRGCGGFLVWRDSSRNVGIAAKFKSRVEVDSIFYLVEDKREGLKLGYVLIPRGSAPRLMEGAIVEFTRRGRENVDILILTGVPPAEVAIAPLQRRHYSADFSERDGSLPYMPSDFRMTSNASFGRDTIFKFMYSPFVSQEDDKCFFIAAVVPVPLEEVMMRKGVLTRNPANNSWMLHYFDEKSNQLRYCSDVERLMGEDYWEDLDCVQFNEPKERNNLTNMKNVLSEDGSKIKAIACTGRVVHVGDGGRMGSLCVDSPYARGTVELQFCSGWPTKKNQFVRVVYSAEVCPRGCGGFLVWRDQSRNVGIAAKFKNRVEVDCIFYLIEDKYAEGGLKLTFVFVPRGSAPRLMEGDIVEFTRRDRDNVALDISVFTGVPPAEVAIAPLQRRHYSADFSERDGSLPYMPSDFRMTSNASFGRDTIFKFMYSPFVSQEDDKCFFIAAVPTAPVVPVRVPVQVPRWMPAVSNNRAGDNWRRK